MNEGTSVLLGLEDEFTVLQLERIDADTVRVVIEVIDPEGACPECGVLTSRIKERPLVGSAISFALRSSAFSFSSCLIRCAASVVTPGLAPASTSRRRCQSRSVSGLIPSRPAT